MMATWNERTNRRMLQVADKTEKEGRVGCDRLSHTKDFY